jgi:hypothetical protein
MVMFILIAWVREVIVKPLAACLTSGFVFTLPMARLLAHPISEDIVRAGLFGFEGKNRSSAVPSIIMVAAKAHAIWQQTG